MKSEPLPWVALLVLNLLWTARHLDGNWVGYVGLVGVVWSTFSVVRRIPGVAP